jgi:hypothetical protein
MYPIPPSEHLVENRICKKCSRTFPITDKDMEFYEKVSPTFGGKKYLIPAPTLCPDCRQQRRETWHNQRTVYKNKCSETGETIISMYHPKTEYKIVSSEFWWSDQWDVQDYWKNIDLKRSFFEQIHVLMIKTPRAWNNLVLCENCNYCDNIRASKDCYFAFNGWAGGLYFERGFYTVATGFGSRDVVDTLWVIYSEDSYWCAHSDHATSSQYCMNCSYVDRCSYMMYSNNCQNCTLCFGIQNKQFHFMNRGYDKEEYTKVVSDFWKLRSDEKWNMFIEFSKWFPRRNHNNIMIEDCYGDYLQSSKKSYYSFYWGDLEATKYCFTAFGCKESMDCANYWIQWELCYETHNIWYAYNVNFSITCTENCRNLYYCENCVSCKDCFWCVWLRNKSYYILNKQYSKEEYEVIVPKIIEIMMSDGEWGEFFPASMSPFGYNETVAQDYNKLNKYEALKRWFNWSDYEAPFPKVEKIIAASKLPDDITKIPDDILNWAIECEVSKKPFRIIRQELEFYRKHNLPIPRRHPDVRHMDRIKMRNPRKLFERKCDKCNKEMITTYAPERPEKVYCEKCYEKEVLS